jgi:Transposase IS116/IS110/IS902 family
VAQLVADLERIYARKKAANKELTEHLAATGTSLLNLHGIGPTGAARLLAEVGDITRFPNKAHFASWNGTAPIDASSGDHVRHRLSRPGLLRTQKGRRQNADGSHALRQAPALRHRLPEHAQRRHQRNRIDRQDGPGRTTGTRL